MYKVNLACLLLIQPSLHCEMRICEIPKCSLSEGLYNCLVLLVARFFEQSDKFDLHWIRRHRVVATNTTQRQLLTNIDLEVLVDNYDLLHSRIVVLDLLVFLCRCFSVSPICTVILLRC